MLHTAIPLSKTLPHLLFPTALSSYALWLCYQNITRLQQYEETSKKAAEWSTTAAQRLHKTRTTQSSGTISILLSLITPLVLLFAPEAARTSPVVLSTSALVNAAILLGARQHMGSFWNESNQTRIPFVQKFNEAVKGSEKVVWVLGTLGLSWGFAGVWWALMGMDWVGGGNVFYGIAVGARMLPMLPGGTFWR